MNYDELAPELQEKIKGCKTPEEMLELAREEGYELTDEELEGVAGGFFWGCSSDCSDFVPQPNYQDYTIPEGSGLSC